MAETSPPAALPRIDTAADLEAGLAALVRCDPRLEAVASGIPLLPLRRAEPGFASLVSIVVSQQISRASAEAIMGRLAGLVDPLTAPALLEGGPAAMVAAGLSRPKQRTLAALATAVEAGDLDLAALCGLDARDAVAQLVGVHGIGPWTAEVYMLFAAGHADVFPAGDVALQAAVADVFALPARPDASTLRGLAESWAPWRGIAARLFWAHYARMRGREAVPVVPGRENAVKSG